MDILKERMTRMYRLTELKLLDPTTNASKAAQLALIGVDLATYIFKIEAEGISAVIGSNSFFNKMRHKAAEAEDTDIRND